LRTATLCFLVRGYPAREVLLGLKKSGFGAGKYNGIGGKVEPGESVTAAVSREVWEEIGVRVLESQLSPVAHLTFEFPHRSGWDQIVYAYLAQEWSGVPRESREMRPRWFGVAAIPYGEMWADDRHWLPRVLAGERVKGWFSFCADNETVAGMELGPWV